MQRKTDLGLLLLRIAIGGLMLSQGISKIFHGTSFLTDTMGIFAYAVYMGEVLAPLSIIFGCRTRIAGFLVAGTSIVAIAVDHSTEIFSLSEHGGYTNELLILYLFGALALFFTGAGKLALSTKNIWD